VRPVAGLAIILALAGCTTLRAWVPPAPRPTGPAGASPTPVPPAGQPAGATAPAGATPPPQTSVAVPPAPPQPPPASSAPSRAPGPAPGGASQAPAPSPGPPALGGTPGGTPPLTASLSADEARKLREDAQRRIEEAEKLLRLIAGRPLAPKDLETLVLAQSLVDQARKALGTEEYERAANLAAKAKTLADDLATVR
jgi:hypothetical protein